MRNQFSKSLVEAAKANPKVMLLTGDHGYSLFDEFRKECPNQFINCGIAEQNMVGVAAGLAKSGFLPVVYGLAAFIPIRVLEQIKLDVCYENLPVIFIGDGAGVVYSTLGVSHQSTEDISALRAIPNISIFSPCDSYEMSAVMESAFKSKSPCYIRIGKSDLGQIHDEIPYISDRLLRIKTMNSSLALIATGSMVKTAQQLSDIYGCNVFTAPILKPLNMEKVYCALAHYSHLAILEEHNILGGLGSIICEIMSYGYSGSIRCIGIEDKFSTLCGSYEFLMKEHGLDLDSIKKKIDNFLDKI